MRVKILNEIVNSKDWAKVYRASNFIEKGVCEYANERVYLSKETLLRACQSMKGRPVIIDHTTGITPENMQQYAVGYVVEADCSLDNSAALDCRFVVFDDEGKAVIAEGYSVSCAYKPKAFGPGGTWHNVPYDREIIDLEFTHLALVQNPRYEDAKVYENAKDSDGKGRWITVKGTHVFVKEGQAVEDAMKSTFSGKSKDKYYRQKEDEDLIGKHGDIQKKKEDLLKKLKATDDIKEGDKILAQIDELNKQQGQLGQKRMDIAKEAYTKSKDLQGKYEREDADFDPEQMQKDIKAAQELGYEEVEDVAEFLGLDEDEVRETMATEKPKAKFDDEGFKKFVEGKKKDISSTGKTKPKNVDKQLSKIVTDRFDYVKTLETQSSDQDDFHELPVWGLKDVLSDAYNLGSGGSGKITDKQLEKIAQTNLLIDTLKERGSDAYDFPEVSVWGLKDAMKSAYELGQKRNKEKHNSKEDKMNVEEFFNKMGDIIEEKFNACKGTKMNEAEEEDDDKFEMDGETYSKKELVNAFKEKKNAEDEAAKEKEKENEGDEEDEKQNSLDGDEFFNAMEKRMQQHKQESDKIEVYSQAKGIEKGRSIYGG